MIDMNKFFVICFNVVGGCMGSIGFVDINLDMGELYVFSFFVIMIGDMVCVQVMLLDYLEILDLFCVLGGLMGGMMVL